MDRNPAPAASKEYLRNAVLTASAEQLQLMLFDGAIRFATRGLEGIRDRNIEEMFTGLERAQRIVLQLSDGLRRDVNPELVDRMAALYGFVYRRLVDGNVHRDPQAVEEALRILRHQRETWVLLMEKLQRERQGVTAASAPPPADAPADAEATSRFVAEG